MQSHWKKVACNCGLGEKHYRYDRADGGMVSRDHGRCGGDLKNHWIGTGSAMEDQIHPHKSPDSAMRKVDLLFPLNNLS